MYRITINGTTVELEGDILCDILYKIHDKLTDKKLLGTITVEEEKLLEEIRNDIEFRNGDKHITDLYQRKIDGYKELLKQIKDLKETIK